MLLEGFEDDNQWAMPPAPLCEVCSHAPCPCCPLPFCDRLLPGCCEVTCTIDLIDFEAWKRECEERGPPEPDDDAGDPPCLVQSEGPWFPCAVRRAVAKLSEPLPGQVLRAVHDDAGRWTIGYVTPRAVQA